MQPRNSDDDSDPWGRDGKNFHPNVVTALMFNDGVDVTDAVSADAQLSFSISVSLTQTAALLLGGDLRITSYAESIGPGEDVVLGEATVPLNGGSQYSVAMTVPPETLPPGRHKVVTVVQHENFGRVTNVSAVHEGEPFDVRS